MTGDIDSQIAAPPANKLIRYTNKSDMKPIDPINRYISINQRNEEPDLNLYGATSGQMLRGVVNFVLGRLREGAPMLSTHLQGGSVHFLAIVEASSGAGHRSLALLEFIAGVVGLIIGAVLLYFLGLFIILTLAQIAPYMVPVSLVVGIVGFIIGVPAIAAGGIIAMIAFIICWPFRELLRLGDLGTYPPAQF